MTWIAQHAMRKDGFGGGLKAIEEGGGDGSGDVESGGGEEEENEIKGELWGDEVEMGHWCSAVQSHGVSGQKGVFGSWSDGGLREESVLLHLAF